ncbi:hypothetical protein [Rhodoferax sp.]|uniref:hypothetical protein n=1 Tax=Rhodoferax sp. TaxID=50421 RepID=UPI0027533BCD|nr:hypothetical protein [Rhodoferax sp.]
MPLKLKLGAHGFSRDDPAFVLAVDLRLGDSCGAVRAAAHRQLTSNERIVKLGVA